MNDILVYLLVFTNLCWFAAFTSYRRTVRTILATKRGEIEK